MINKTAAFPVSGNDVIEKVINLSRQIKGHVN